MTRRHYSDADRAIALAMLAANGDNVKRRSRDLGIAQVLVLLQQANADERRRVADWLRQQETA